MTNRNWFHALVLLLAMSVLNVPLAAQAPLKKVTIVTSGQALQYFVLYVAQHAGYFKDEGLDLDLVAVNSGPKVAASVQGGSAELGGLGCFEVASAVANGSNLTLLTSTYNRAPLSVVLSNDAVAKTGITQGMPIDERLKRMHGLHIGITSPGSATDLLIRSLYLARHMDPDKELTLQPVGTDQAMLAAFEKHVIDGLVFGAPIPQLAVQKKLGQIVISPFDDNIPELDQVMFVCLTATRDALTQKADIIYPAMRAVTKAMKLLRTQPDEARRFTRMTYNTIDEDLFNAAFATYLKGVPESPVISPTQMETTLAWRNIGMSPPLNMKYDTIVSPDMAQRATREIMEK